MKAVNLLPPELRGPAKPAAGAVSEPSQTGRVGAFALLGALAFCVIALAGYVLTSNTVKQRESELAQVTVEAQTAAQRAAELKPYADFEAMAATRIQTVRDLAASRFDWEQALRDISRAIPGAVTLEKLNGTISTESGGASAVRGAISAPAIELAGCTTGQTAVATLMARLRNVEGVTRVSLQKSEKPAATDGVQVVEGDPCGTGRNPAFELVIFFERSQVPASVQEVTVQATAAAGGAEGTVPATGGQPASADGTVPAQPGQPGQPAADGGTPETTGAGDGTPASTTTGAG